MDQINTIIGPLEYTNPRWLPRELGGIQEPFIGMDELLQYGAKLSATKRDIFWRTLVLGTWDRGRGRRTYPAPAEIGHWFEVMLGNQSEVDGIGILEANKRFCQQIGFVDRCYYTTASGKMGIGPYGTQRGDIVTILYGGQFCYILREVGEHYVLVGDAYLHGAMYGELVDPDRPEERGKYEERTFVLR